MKENPKSLKFDFPAIERPEASASPVETSQILSTARDEFHDVQLCNDYCNGKTGVNLILFAELEMQLL